MIEKSYQNNPFIYTFEPMVSGKYQVRLCGEFVCYSNHTKDQNIDRYLKKKGFETRKQYLEFCLKGY